MTVAVPGLGIVVVNYASHHLLRENLVPSTVDGATVVVVDNRSTLTERDAVAALCAEHGWDLVASEVNAGFGAGMNLGVTRARAKGCDVFLLLNPDARLAPADVARLAELSRAEPSFLIAPVITREDGTLWSVGSRVDLRTGRMGRAPQPFRSGTDRWLTGACLTIHRQAWDSLGGFTDGWFLYWEDVDLSRRCVDLGGQLMIATDVVAVHAVGGTQSTADPRIKSATYYRYNCRNRLLFASRHLPTTSLIRWLAHTPGESLAVLLRGGRRQIVTSPGVVVATIDGTLRGVGLAVRELVVRFVRRIRPAVRK